MSRDNAHNAHYASAPSVVTPVASAGPNRVTREVPSRVLTIPSDDALKAAIAERDVERIGVWYDLLRDSFARVVVLAANYAPKDELLAAIVRAE